MHLNINSFYMLYCSLTELASIILLQILHLTFMYFFWPVNVGLVEISCIEDLFEVGQLSMCA